MDRSIRQMNGTLTAMRRIGPVAPQSPGESFRSYFQRVAEPWRAEHHLLHPELVQRIEIILTYERRRHPARPAE